MNNKESMVAKIAIVPLLSKIKEGELYSTPVSSILEHTAIDGKREK